ncbi:hypothetical protein BH24ACT15_BH24ACT15_37090 [soil metagenome]
MRRYFIAALLALVVSVGGSAAPAAAITGGQPDGNGHPYVGLLLAPGITFCSRALISDSTILTAGHCTDLWDWLLTQPQYGFGGEILVSFDTQASVDDDWMPAGGTWYAASSWLMHPLYVDEEWPYTWDYGLLYISTSRSISSLPCFRPRG